jgi:hypothetical protein
VFGGFSAIHNAIGVEIRFFIKEESLGYKRFADYPLPTSLYAQVYFSLFVSSRSGGSNQRYLHTTLYITAKDVVFPTL